MRVAGQSEKRRDSPALLPDPTQRAGGRPKVLGTWSHCANSGPTAYPYPSRCPVEAEAGGRDKWGTPTRGQIASSASGVSEQTLSLSHQSVLPLTKVFEDTFLLPLHSVGFAKLLALPTPWDFLKRLLICSVDTEVFYLFSFPRQLRNVLQHTSPSSRVISKDSCKTRRLCPKLENKPPLVDAQNMLVD